jgi:hypothetical protein
VCTLGSTEAVKRAVAEGFGVSFVSGKSITGDPEVDGVKVVKVRNISIKRDFYVTALNSTLDKGPVDAFYSFVVKYK